MSVGRRVVLLGICGALAVWPAASRSEELDDFLAKQNKAITLNASEADVTTILKTISRAGDFDLILDPALTAKISVRMKDVPVGVALARVLELGGIAAGVQDGVLLAYPKDGVRVFHLKHAPAARVQDVVKPFVIGKVSVDPKTNTLIVQDSPQVLNRIQKLLVQLDRRPRQVDVEAAIISTQLNDVTNLGVNFNKIAVIADDRLTINTAQFANVDPLTPNPLPGPQGLFLSYIRTQGGITAVLQALQQTTDFKVLSHPRLQALSGEEAQIKVGSELGFLTSTISVGGGAGGAPAAGGSVVSTQQTQFLDVGTMLKFTPEVSDDGVVDLVLKPEVSDGNIDARTGLPSKNTSQMTTRVKIRSGQTLLLGGMIRTRDEKTTNKVPILGSIPLLGALFRSTATTKASDEIVVMITPTVEPDPDEDIGSPLGLPLPVGWHPPMLLGQNSFSAPEPPKEAVRRATPPEPAYFPTPDVPPAPAAEQVALKRLIRSKVEELEDAGMKKDFAREIDLTYPKAIESLGGREKAIAMERAMVESGESQGASGVGYKVGVPSDPVSSGSDLFVLVPYVFEMKVPGGKLLQKLSVIGISEDQGKTWTFLDTAPGRDALRQVVPNLPDQLRIPEKEKSVFVKD